MIRKRWPKMVGLICCFTMLSGLIAFLFYRSGIVKYSDQQIDTINWYTIDAYDGVALRDAAFVSSKVVCYLGKKTNVKILSDTVGPMIKIQTEDNRVGYVPQKYLSRSEMAPLIRANRKQVKSSDKIYYIKWDSVELYSGNSDESIIYEYLVRGTPIRVIKWDDDTDKNDHVQVVNCESGLIGYLIEGETYHPFQSEGEFEQFGENKGPDGNSLSENLKVDNKIVYSINSDNLVYLYREPSITSQVVSVVPPGTWVSLLQTSSKGWCKIRKYNDINVEGYIQQDLLGVNIK